jgi:hypothetical protein
MEFSLFIEGLVKEGKVSINGALSSIEPGDIEEAMELLRTNYEEDILELPNVAPAWSEKAALWAAKYFFHAVQFTVLRDKGKEIIEQHLKPFPLEIRAEEIYSADLILRNLPSLFDLAKGLAPADFLVKNLMGLAKAWPYSSVGITLEGEINDKSILSHPSLRQVYIDRIIVKKDNSRINKRTESFLLETTGEYLSTFWPEYESKQN